MGSGVSKTQQCKYSFEIIGHCTVHTIVKYTHMHTHAPQQPPPPPPNPSSACSLALQLPYPSFLLHPTSSFTHISALAPFLLLPVAHCRSPVTIRVRCSVSRSGTYDTTQSAPTPRSCFPHTPCFSPELASPPCLLLPPPRPRPQRRTVMGRSHISPPYVSPMTMGHVLGAQRD